MAKILTLDIETAPNLAYVWGLWKQNVAIGQIEKSGEVMCFAAKWKGRKKVEFVSAHELGRHGMLKRAHELLSEADIVVTFNGQSFDIPWLMAEFFTEGFAPPAPFQQVDLYRVARRRMRFPSNKLDYIAQRAGLGGKFHHSGFDLWLGCMRGDEKSWREMRTYNRQDVVLTEQLYDRLLPWVNDHPHVGLLDDDPFACPNCGGHKFQSRGWAYTKLGRYHRYMCKACGTWTRNGRRNEGAVQRGVA